MYPNKYITELLKDALQSEAMTEAFYEKLAADVSDIDDKERLKQMSLDESKHYNMLSEIYDTLTGDAFELEKENKENKEESSVPDRIAGAIDKELASVEMYRPILFALENPGFKNYLQEIITDEQNHAARLNYMYSKNK